MRVQATVVAGATLFPNTRYPIDIRKVVRSLESSVSAVGLVPIQVRSFLWTFASVAVAAVAINALADRPKSSRGMFEEMAGVTTAGSVLSYGLMYFFDRPTFQRTPLLYVGLFSSFTSVLLMSDMGASCQ